VRRWPEPADLHFLLSHTKHNWSPAVDDADDDGATHDMVDKCGVGGQPRWDFLSIHTRLWCWPYARRWSEPADLPLLPSQAKHNWSPAADDADDDGATNEMVAQCSAGGQPRWDLLGIHTRLWCWPYARRWREPADLPLLSSQTKHHLSPAADDADDDGATHDMVAQCSAGGKPRWDLLSIHTRLWCWPYARRWPEPADLPLLPSQKKRNWSLAADDADVDGDKHDMVAQCGDASQDGTSKVYIRGCGVGPTREDGLSRLIYLYYRSKQSITGRQQRMAPMMMAIHTIWWPNVVLAASQDGTPSVYIRDCSIVCR
jgi:hypothetical protein